MRGLLLLPAKPAEPRFLEGLRSAIFRCVHGIYHGSSQAAAFQCGHASDCGAAGRADGIFHSPRMRARFELELSGSCYHLGGQAVCGVSREPVHDGGIGESFQKHAGEGGAAAADGTGNGKLICIDKLH